MTTKRIDTPFTVTYADPNVTVTYASGYDAFSTSGTTLVVATVVGSDHNVLIGNGTTNTTVDWRKDTSLSASSRSDFVTKVEALVVASVSTPDNHYVITTKAEFDTAITDATAAAVPYRFEIAAGTYAFTAQVVFPDNGSIIGAGERATILTTTDESASGAFSINSTNCEFRDLTFNHLDNGDTVNFYGMVSITQGNDKTVRFTHCRFTRFNSIAVALPNSFTSGFVVDFIGCTFDEPHTSGSDTSIYMITNAPGNVRVKDCIFKDVEYAYYSDAATPPNEEITGCLFDSNGTNPVYIIDDSARSIKVTNNEFRDCAGDIVFPSTATNLTAHTFGGNVFDNFTGTRPTQVGEEVRDEQDTDLSYNNNLTVNACTISNLVPGTWLLSYRAKLTDVGAFSQCAIVLDNSGDGSGDSITSGTAYLNAIVADSQSTTDEGTEDDMTWSGVYTNTGTNNLHLVFANRFSSTATGLQVDYGGTLVTSGDNHAYLSAVRIS
jgi:methionine-rich copper-binding protein CopC